MAFSPFFQATLTGTLVRQLMAILQRDMAAALASVSSSLSVPLEWNVVDYSPQQWPAILVVPQTVIFSNPAAVQARPQTTIIKLSVALANQDRNLLASQVWDYTLAIDRIVASLGAQVNPANTPNFDDFYAPLPLVVPFPQSPVQSVINVTTAGMQTGSVLACYPTRLDYGAMDRSAVGWTMTASELVEIQTEEAGVNQ